MGRDWVSPLNTLPILNILGIWGFDMVLLVSHFLLRDVQFTLNSNAQEGNY